MLFGQVTTSENSNSMYNGHGPSMTSSGALHSDSTPEMKMSPQQSVWNRKVAELKNRKREAELTNKRKL